MSTAINGRVCLRDEIILFFVASQIIDLVRDATIMDFAIRSFDKSEFVDSRESRHRTDETDVRTFRCLDRTNTAVMRRMNVAHFESRAIARETAWSQRRQAALVRQFGERIRLIHELRELRAAEEIANDRAERLWIH